MPVSAFLYPSGRYAECIGLSVSQPESGWVTNWRFGWSGSGLTGDEEHHPVFERSDWRFSNLRAQFEQFRWRQVSFGKKVPAFFELDNVLQADLPVDLDTYWSTNWQREFCGITTPLYLRSRTLCRNKQVTLVARTIVEPSSQLSAPSACRWQHVVPDVAFAEA